MPGDVSPNCGGLDCRPLAVVLRPWGASDLRGQDCLLAAGQQSFLGSTPLDSLVTSEWRLTAPYLHFFVGAGVSQPRYVGCWSQIRTLSPGGRFREAEGLRVDLSNIQRYTMSDLRKHYKKITRLSSGRWITMFKTYILSATIAPEGSWLMSSLPQAVPFIMVIADCPGVDTLLQQIGNDGRCRVHVTQIDPGYWCHGLLLATTPSAVVENFVVGVLLLTEAAEAAMCQFADRLREALRQSVIPVPVSTYRLVETAV